MTEDRKIKVLCVEDEQDIRENMAEILRDEGFEVFEAENGKRGFEVFLQQKPDIIISDIMMPEVDGYVILKLIREDKTIRNSNIPFILLTALGQKDNVIKGVDLSANDYLIKPVDFDLMIAKIKEKTKNAGRISEAHNQTIQHIKDQITVALPDTALTYLDIITRISASLKDEPYGPLPHRGYIEEFEKIHVNAVKLLAAIHNALDSSVIDYKLNANEEVVTLSSFLMELINSLDAQIKPRIILEKSSDSDAKIRVKIDRLLLVEALRQIIAGIFKADPEGMLNLRLMRDPLDQMVIIFYLRSKMKNANLPSNIPQQEIGKILDQQNCRLEIVEGRENTAILIIPDHRVV